MAGRIIYGGIRRLGISIPAIIDVDVGVAMFREPGESRASALAPISASLTSACAMYQELQPIGGVSGSVFPTTIRKTRVAFPCELLALI